MAGELSAKYCRIARDSSAVIFARTRMCMTIVAVMRGEYARTAEWQRMQLFLYASSGSTAALVDLLPATRGSAVRQIRRHASKLFI